jgi:hypothetical protein
MIGRRLRLREQYDKYFDKMEKPEPVTQGIVQSLARPGGNMTGFSYVEPSIGAKWIKNSGFAIAVTLLVVGTILWLTSNTGSTSHSINIPSQAFHHLQPVW